MTDHARTVATAVGLLNAGDVDGYVTRLYTEDAVFHGFPPQVPPGRDGIAAFFHALRAGMPDAHIGAEDVVAQGDRVAVRFTLTGTHTGELLGASRTGRRIAVEGITILRFRGERVAERWNRLDDVALLTQVGLLPAPAETEAVNR
ncbi:ester cyclase [Blastococcus deserti]|uniref:Ester cyclase n=1 Tax=Blastococcus deserti TaxID=2259033 RepID=A0ABW4XCN4_9ACTN